MALSRELSRRLESNEEPLAKRLKLAENTFTSEDFPVTRKEDLVLRWLCEQIEKEGTNSAPILNTLTKCLRFKMFCPMVIFKTDIKQILVDTLIRKLSHAESTELREVMEACTMIFLNREMHRYFQTNLLSIANLITSLVACISARKSNRNIDEGEALLKDEGRTCVIHGIECLVTCYKQSTNKDEIAEILISQMLYPLCSLVNMNQHDRLGAEIHKCIQQLIFGKSRFLQFKDFIGKEDNFVLKLFEELKKKVDSYEVQITVVAFSYIFRAAAGSYKNDPATIDRVFRNLMNSAGPVKVKVFANIKQQLSNVGFDYQNKIGESTLFEYLQMLIDEVISSEILNDVHYKALESIAVLNPLIIETKMQNIFERILFEEKKNGDEINSYTDLMVAIIEAGVRLRREQKLIPWILKAVEIKLEESNKLKLNFETVFPVGFKKHFSKSVGNMTSAQTIGVLRTLIYHLNNCAAMVTKNKIGTFMLQATADLMSAYFEGVRIFDHSIQISSQDKFIQGLRELGKTISLLTDTIMEIGDNEKMIAAVLSVVWYWDSMHAWMEHYVPDAVSQKLDFPISESRVREIMENIDSLNCKKAMNRILVQQMGRNLEESKPFDSSNLLDGFENSWSIILDHSPHVISSMNNSQIAELAKHLLDDLKCSQTKDLQPLKRLNVESVQNDERFLKSLVYQILVDISEKVNESMTKTIAGHVDVVKILNRGSTSKLTKHMKSDLTRKEWKTLNEESLSIVEKDLRILLHLPLKYFGLDFRKALFLVIYSIKNESRGNETILQICSRISIDLSEKLDIDVIDLIDSDSLIYELTHDKSNRRVIESSLKNISNWETLKILVKKSQKTDSSTALLLECIERVKPKLKGEEKEIFKKAEQRLSRKLLDNMNDEFKDPDNIKRFTLALRVSTTNGQIPENLMAITKSIINKIFLTDAVTDGKFITEGLHLMSVVLKLGGKLDLNEKILKNVWPHVLNNPVKDIALPILERAEPKALKKLFMLLHSQTITALTASDDVTFKRSLIIWNCVTSIPMRDARQKFRITALHYLLQALLISNIHVNFWPPVLQFVRSILPESLHVIEKSIDLVTLLVARSLKEAELNACEYALVLSSSLVKFNAPIIIDRLPILLGLYRKIVELVVRESRKDNDSSRLRILGCLALDIEKFTNALVKLKKDLVRISPYVIADLVGIFSEGVIPPRVKGPLEDSVGHFLSICDQHAISLLSRTLPTSTRGIFQTLYDTYNKFHKFTGKI
ncbi:uncharacterized protein [Venturia canescens]|uniref:uncharacterized protein isoform X2 n=1 Tax=Venturia canescens TaxID=32260 RepID=UPI001C9C03F5|nr:uncharacterized protein LOC122413711 isoform X2 [Venturia canescens]